MPTPVGHSLAGLAVHLASRETPRLPAVASATALVAIANLPDIDFLPGYLLGEPRAFHWGPTHSFTAALIVGCAAGIIARIRTGAFLPFFVLAFVAYSSHVAMDMLLGPGAPSQGLPALWPLSGERYTTPFAVFQMFPAAPPGRGPIGMLFSTAVLPLLVREALIMVPVCVAAWMLGRRSRREGAVRSAPRRRGLWSLKNPLESES